MISEVYDALISAATDEVRSRKAAEALTESDVRLNGMSNDIAGMKGDVALLKWMGGVLIAFDLAIVLKLFIH